MNSNSDLYAQKLSYRSNGAPAQCLAQPWFIRAPHRVYYPRHGCELKPLNCGKRVFESISDDLNAAQHTVDIITWGFDPGMVLVRGATAEVGMRYGDLLKKIATRKKNPVTVRLLVWHDDAAAQNQMNNVPGYYGRRFPNIGASVMGFYSDIHQQYSAAWFHEVCSGAIPNIQFHVRDISRAYLISALLNESLPEGIRLTGLAATLYPTHHQKMVLIDYEMPGRAVGYVMGHNSTTEFWDTEQHIFRDPQRETIYVNSESDVRASAQGKIRSNDGVVLAYHQSERGKLEHAKMVQSYIDGNSRVAKPYQDVSCRVRGPVLYDLNDNFCQAWGKSERPSHIFLDTFKVIPGLRAIAKGVRTGCDFFRGEPDSEFVARRAKIPVRAFNLPGGQHSAQLVRTQPQHGEKGAKECYANLTRQMLRYMFIQNQYIQYVMWADHLLECVERLRAAGYRKPIHIFMLTSTPERDGMDLPTYQVAAKVGISDTMKVEHEAAVAEARKGKSPPPITAEQMQKQGVNVFMGSMWTCPDREGTLQSSDYEEIYIHAKVAVVDDAAFTIGSTNLNLRSMAIDSELNILSEAKDVAFELRTDLFRQCSGMTGPDQFGDMARTFKDWHATASINMQSKQIGTKLTCQLLPFHVDRKPGSSVV